MNRLPNKTTKNRNNLKHTTKRRRRNRIFFRCRFFRGPYSLRIVLAVAGSTKHNWIKWRMFSMNECMEQKKKKEPGSEFNLVDDEKTN